MCEIRSTNSIDSYEIGLTDSFNLCEIDSMILFKLCEIDLTTSYELHGNSFEHGENKFDDTKIRLHDFAPQIILHPNLYVHFYQGGHYESLFLPKFVVSYERGWRRKEGISLFMKGRMRREGGYVK